LKLKESAVYGLVVMMCINIFTGMLSTIGIQGTPVSGQVTEAWNASTLVETFDWGTNAFYDIGSGLAFWWYRSIPLIEAFPATLQNYGCPSFIYNPIHDIWRFMWVTFVALVVIAGRDI